MKDQHTQIKGYRDLNQGEIELTNHWKNVEEQLRVMLNTMQQQLQPVDPEAVRWVALARTYLEAGIMFAIKAVTRPANGLGRSNADNRTQAEIEAAEATQTDAPEQSARLD